MKNNFYKHTGSFLFLFFCLTYFISPQVAEAQGTNPEYNIKGTITSALNSEPLVGVNIGFPGTTIGTTTDIDGKYELVVPANSATIAEAKLEISYVGYKTQVVNIDGRSLINISMEEDAKLLGEVVAIGYGTTKKSDFTGSVSSVRGAELSKVPTGAVGQSMQGKLAGVNVTQSSGEPGSQPVIRIRGIGSYGNGASEPLYVVDNQIVEDIKWLNPNDVESIDVLKDASSIAIYGARGSNGVIMITTKKGKFNEAGKVYLSTFTGTQKLIRKIGLTNAREYALLSNEIASNDGRPPIFPNPDSLGEGTDWQDIVYHDAPIYSINLGARGGGEKYTYNVNGEYFKQEGIIRGSEFNRISLRFNNEFKVNKILKVGNNIAYNMYRGSGAPNVVGSAYKADPTVISRNDAGQYGNTSIRTSVGNPAAALDNYNQKGRLNQIVGLVYADISILKSLSFRSNYSVDIANLYDANFRPEYYVSPEEQSLENQLTVRQNRNQRWLWENVVSFNKEFGAFNLNAIAGVTMQEDLAESFEGSRKNLLAYNEDQLYLDLGDVTTSTSSSNGTSSSLLSYLGRVNLNFMQRYLLTASFRRDGSSRFGANNKYGNFPSAAFAWRIIDEPFMRGQDLLSNLKFRSSYGLVGNDRIGGDYTFATQLTTSLDAVFGINGQEYIIPGATQVSLANPNIKWESARQLDLGLEFGLFQNRLNFELDYFNRITDDLILRVPIPDYVGSEENPVVNTGSIKNEGLEITAGLQGGKNLHWTLSANSTFMRNEVIKLGDGLDYIYDGGLGVGGLLGTVTRVGLPIGSYYGYHVLGIFQNEADLLAYPKRGPEKAGDLIYQDANGDGVITDKDRVVLGDNIPNFTYGFSGRIDFKGFDIGVDFFGMSGFEIINSKKMARFNTPNFEDSFLDRWTGEGTSNSEPRITNGGHNYEFSDRFVEKGDFLRLRTVMIGFNVPSKFLSKIKMSNFRIYVSATNLMTWTQYSGYTSEIISQSPIDSGIDRGTYPLQKVYTLGLNCSF
ncbi:MAG: TonB-dependent receptor [Saprospiraceae bacterium]